MKKDKCLVVFVKNEVLGKVKTRLASTIGDEAALQVYKQLLDYTRDICMQVEADVVVYFSDQMIVSGRWASDKFVTKLQIQGDLGMKMKAALTEQLISYHKVCIIGSDCPALTSIIIDEAFDRLSDHDCVLGPSIDGGYYLLGMKKLHACLFENMPWSSDQVLKQTIERLSSRSLSYSLLASLQDIDDEQDLIDTGFLDRG